MTWIFGLVLALVVILLVIAIVQRLVKMALFVAFVGFGGLALYYVFLATASAPVISQAARICGMLR